MAHHLTRRRALLALGATAGAAAAWRGAMAAGTPPLRIGLLTVKTGPLAPVGQEWNEGITIFLKQRGYRLAGRPVDLIAADTGGTPAGAISKTRELVERHHVHLIIGPVAAFEALAIDTYIRKVKVPILSLAGAEDMTQRHPNPWLLRAATTSAQGPQVMGYYAAKELKLKRVATIAEDFAFGYENCGGFQRVFEDNGGKVVKKLWPPLGAPDFVPYVAQIHDVDGVFMGLTGADPIKFMRACATMGLKSKVQLMGGEAAVDDPLLSHMGDEALGVLSASSFSSELDTPTAKALRAATARDYHDVPGAPTITAYVNGMCIEAALKATGGRTDDEAALMAALRAVRLTDTPMGPIHFDHLGNVVADTFVRKVEKRDGKLVNVIIKTYPQVSQFWTYDEKTFLAQPPDSRDYPPVRYAEP
jgi:branched-chain amino acid transport system substrate-binding protein